MSRIARSCVKDKSSDHFKHFPFLQQFHYRDALSFTFQIDNSRNAK